MTGRMRGKRSTVAVVTGGASGIGKAITSVLADRGDTVVVLDIAAQPPERGGSPWAHWIATDVGDEESVEDAIKTVEDLFGGVDVLVNNAGIGRPLSLRDTTLEDWTATMRVNATGVFLCTRAALWSMERRGSGCVVSISSTNASIGTTGTAASAASKGAVEAFTRAAAAELGRIGIRVNAVSPGAIDTPMWGERLTDEVRSLVSEAAALGRIGTAADIAAAVEYLTSQAAQFITGVVLPVCGGRSTTEPLRLPSGGP